MVSVALIAWQPVLTTSYCFNKSSYITSKSLLAFLQALKTLVIRAGLSKLSMHYIKMQYDAVQYVHQAHPTVSCIHLVYTHGSLALGKATIKHLAKIRFTVKCSRLHLLTVNQNHNPVSMCALNVDFYASVNLCKHCRQEL